MKRFILGLILGVIVGLSGPSLVFGGILFLVGLILGRF